LAAAISGFGCRRQGTPADLFILEFYRLGLRRWTKYRRLFLCCFVNGLSSRKVKKAVGKLTVKKGLSHQNVMRISGRIVEEFNVLKKRDLSELRRDLSRRLCLAIKFHIEEL
jgi:hypothetical protein